MNRPACLLSLILFLPLPAAAELSISVSKSPDTKTRFIWAGADLKANRDKTLYLIVEHGTQKTGTNVSDELLVRFARNEMGKIKWCSYIGTDLQVTKCKPNQPLFPDGEIKLK